MTQEEKSLLLKDLCARLPYGVIVYDYDREETREMGLGTLHDIMFNDLECKPYLRPMSSMTNEELHEVQEILGKGVEIREDFILSIDSSINSFTYLELQAVFDWLNAHHFDYTGLIKSGLALEASEGMYN